MSLEADWMIARCWALAGLGARAGGFATLVPALSLGASVRYRVLLAVTLTLLMAPLTTFSERVGGLAGAASFAHEFATGALLGFALRAVWSGVAVASQLVSQQMGLSIIHDDGEEMTGSALGRLHELSAWVLFVTCGGERAVVSALLDAAPVSSGNVPALGDAAVTLLSHAFGLALHVSVPVVIALVATHLAIGMISRVVPQFPFSSGAQGLQILFALALSFLAIGLFRPAIQQTIDWAISSIR